MKNPKIKFSLKLILYYLFDLRIPSAATLIQASLTLLSDYKDDLTLGGPNSKIWTVSSILQSVSIYEHNSVPACWNPTTPSFSTILLRCSGFLSKIIYYYLHAPFIRVIQFLYGPPQITCPFLLLRFLSFFFFFLIMFDLECLLFPSYYLGKQNPFRGTW